MPVGVGDVRLMYVLNLLYIAPIGSMHLLYFT